MYQKNMVGLGLDKMSSALIAEKFSLAGGFSITHGAHVGSALYPLYFLVMKNKRKNIYLSLATERIISAYALNRARFRFRCIRCQNNCKLNDAGTHYVLNGEKQCITNSAFADVFIVYAKIDGEHFSAFIVEREYPGVSTGPEEKKMGIKSSSTRTLILISAEVPVENLLGEMGRGTLLLLIF